MKLNIVIIGGGMYVSGRGTDGYGTVLPAISSWKKKTQNLGELICVTTNITTAEETMQKAKGLEGETKVPLDLATYPNSEQNNTNYLDVIKKIPKPACAVIVVPDHLHYEVASDCLREGLHVLLVKPMTPKASEAIDLIEIAQTQKLYGSVEFHKRLDKSNLILKNKFLDGDLGQPLNFLVEYSQRKSVPTETFRSWSSQTNILQYLGIHYIDIVRFVTSAKPVRVMAIGQKSFLVQNGVDSYDSIQCSIEWKLPNGELFTQNLNTNWIDPESSPAHSNQSIKLIGTKGRYEADQMNRGISLNIEERGIEHINPDFCFPFVNDDGSKLWSGYGIDSISNYFNDVIALISGDVSLEFLNKTRPSFEEALCSTQIIEAANLSLERNSDWIKIEEKHS